MRLKCVGALRWFPQATEWRTHVECALNHSHLLKSTVSSTSFSSLSLGPGVLALRFCALVTDDIYKGFSVSMLIQRWPPPCPEIHIHQDMKGYNLSCISSSAHFLIRSYISSGFELKLSAPADYIQTKLQRKRRVTLAAQHSDEPPRLAKCLSFDSALMEVVFASGCTHTANQALV